MNILKCLERNMTSTNKTDTSMILLKMMIIERKIETKETSYSHADIQKVYWFQWIKMETEEKPVLENKNNIKVNNCKMMTRANERLRNSVL